MSRFAHVVLSTVLMAMMPGCARAFAESDSIDRAISLMMFSYLTAPRGTYAYAANETANTLSMYQVDSSGQLNPIGTVSVQAPSAITVDAASRFAYVSSNTSSQVVIYSINSGTGMLNLETFVAAGAQVQGSAINSTGNFFYVVNQASATVSMYRVSGSQLTSLGTVGTAAAPVRVAIDPQNRFAYATNYTGNSVSMYTMNASTGVLTANGAQAGIPSASGIGINASGQYLFVNSSTPAVSSYSINQGSGVLTLVNSAATGASPLELALHPSNRFMYSANNGTTTVSITGVNTSTGMLTAAGSATAGTQPFGAKIDPTGNFLYVANSGSANISCFAINQSTGALTSIGTVASGVGSKSIAFASF